MSDGETSSLLPPIADACTHIRRNELFWRLACVYGTIIYVRVDNGRRQRILGDDLSLGDADTALKHVIPFLTAGLSLPSVEQP